MAYQIWKNATDKDPSLLHEIPELPEVAYSAMPHVGSAERPQGALVYIRTEDDTDALTWVDEKGKAVTQSQLAILRAAECRPDTPTIPRAENHHALVRAGIQQVLREECLAGGQLGRSSGARSRVYLRLKSYAASLKGTLDDLPDLHRAIDDIYRLPLRETATDSLNRQLRLGASDEELAQIIISLREAGHLTTAEPEAKKIEPRILCSLGLVSSRGLLDDR